MKNAYINVTPAFSVTPAEAGVWSWLYRRMPAFAGMTVGVALLMIFSNPALAACTSPAGTYGEIDFNDDYNMLEYCDDTSWIPMYFNDYWANGVTFDGTNDYLSGGALNGVTDSKQFTFSFWFRRNGGIGSSQYLMQFDANDCRFSIGNTNYLTLSCTEPTATTTVLSIRTNVTITDTNWHHVVMSFDMGTNSRYLYLDGVSALHTNAATDSLLNFSATSVLIGDSGATDLNADIADFWFDADTYIDLSNAANRAKFRDSRGKPVNLGANGSRVTGTAPDIFLSGATASWETNKGTGGGFTENGALTDATLDPGDNQETNVATGLVAQWKFNEAAGSTTAADSIGGFTGTLTNMTPASDWVIGQMGGALDFDGSNDYVSVPSNAAFNFSVNADFTVSMWAKIPVSAQPKEGITTTTDLISKWEGAGGYPFAIRYRNATSPSVGTIQAYRHDGTNTPTCASTKSILDNMFHHIAFVKSGGTLYVYIDGKLENSCADTTTGTTTNAAPLYISTRDNSNTRNTQATIDDVRIYNIGLTQSQVQQLAGCTSPFGMSGTIRYNQDYHVMQFCDGRDWLAMGEAGNGGAGCTSPAGIEGEMGYNQDYKTMQYCEGDTWVAIGRRCRMAVCGGTTTEKLVFVGSGGSAGNYGGVSGADTTCQGYATSMGFRGTYKAWLADSDPSSAPATRFIRSSVPYMMVEGTKVADNWADLTDGTLDHEINFRYNGTDTTLSNAAIATNVNTNGTQYGSAATDHCTNWTSNAGNYRAGDVRYNDAFWTNRTMNGCSSGHQFFYCFEQ